MRSLFLLILFHLSICLLNSQLIDNDNPSAIKQENVQNPQPNSNPQQAVQIEENIINPHDVEEVILNKDDAEDNHIDIDTNSMNNNNQQITEKAKTTPSTTQSSYAWVSLIDTNITNIMGARVLSQSLSKHKSTAARVLICAPEIPDKTLHMMKDFGWEIYSIDVNMFAKMKNYPENIKLELLKILMFNFTEYSSVGYLSPQSMITTNIDHLFKCGENALCGTPNDRHYQIYHKNQRHIKKLLDTNDAELDGVEYIVYDDDDGHIMDNNERSVLIGNHEAVFDDNIFLMTPETALYMDMFTFITSSHDEMEGLQHDKASYFPSYLSEYFYHYCKGNGYPISKQEGQYIPPNVVFDCSDATDECEITKEISKSPCYILEEGYNFHPSHNDHISSSWHWKQSMKHLSIKIIQYSSYNAYNEYTMTDIDHNDYKPWKWRYVLFSGWMIEWSTFADVEPNLYYAYLLNDDAQDELIYSLWQKPILYLIFIIIFLSSITALSAPCFNLLSYSIDRVSTTWPSLVFIVIHVYKWSVLPVLLVWSVFIIITPLKQIMDDEIIPDSYPFKKAWILAVQYCYFTSCFKFIITCYVMYWLGHVYHPIKFKIKWFDCLQLKLFALNMTRKYQYQYQYQYNDIERGMRYNRSSNHRGNVDSNWFTHIIIRIQHWNDTFLRTLLKYCSILVLIVLKWCLWYMFCIVVVLWTIWILRFNDWFELKVIVGTELILSLLWLVYTSINVLCQFFIFPQIKKFGDKYYDSDAFEKGI